MRFYETYTPRHYGRVISKSWGPVSEKALRHRNLNRNVIGAYHYERATIGDFIVRDTADGNRIVFKCFCIENEGPGSTASGSDLRIVAGEYNIMWYNTSVWLPRPGKNDFKLAREGPNPLFPFLPRSKDDSKGTRGLGVVVSDKNVPTDGRGFAKWIHARGRSGIMIHLGRDPTGSEGCLLLTDKIDKVNKKTEPDTPDEYTGGNMFDRAATHRAIVKFYELVEAWGPHQFVLYVTDPDTPPPPDYETEKVEGDDYNDSDDDDAYDPMNVPSYNRMEHRMNTKNGYYDLKIDFSTTI